MRNLIFFTILMCSAGLLSAQKPSSENKTTGTIQVVGEAMMTITADYVEISINVSNEAASAQEAHKKTTEEMAKALKMLKANQSVTELQTTMVTVRPRNYGNSNSMRYFANQSLNFRLNDISQYDNLMLSLFENGINGMGGVNFRSTKAASFNDELMVIALEDARKKAILMARVYGQEVGMALSISETAQGNQGPSPMFSAEYKAGSADPSISEGTIQLVQNVFVEFQLK